METRVVRQVFEGRTLSEDEKQRLEAYALKRRGQIKDAQQRKRERVSHILSVLKKANAG